MTFNDFKETILLNCFEIFNEYISSIIGLKVWPFEFLTLNDDADDGAALSAKETIIFVLLW